MANVCFNRIVSWRVAGHMRMDLVLGAVGVARKSRRPQLARLPRRWDVEAQLTLLRQGQQLAKSFTARRSAASATVAPPPWSEPSAAATRRNLSACSLSPGDARPAGHRADHPRLGSLAQHPTPVGHPGRPAARRTRRGSTLQNNSTGPGRDHMTRASIKTRATQCATYLTTSRQMCQKVVPHTRSGCLGARPSARSGRGDYAPPWWMPNASTVHEAGPARSPTPDAGAHMSPTASANPPMP